MRSTPQMLLAAQAAHQQIASEQNARRERARNQRAREHRTHAMGITGAVVVLAAALAAGLYYGVGWLSPPPVALEKAKPDTFALTRTGHIYVPVDGGGFCKSIEFDNRSGAFNNLGLVGCDDITAKATGPKPAHTGTYNSFSESFKKR